MLQQVLVPYIIGDLAAASGHFSRQRRQPCVGDIVGQYVVVCDGSHLALDSIVCLDIQ
jgi:hypothetical protein